MRRDFWRRRNDSLDPETQFVEIYRNLMAYEFPWDMNQALSFALFRTYAVPGIGRLLDETGQFTGDVQKRYDDTVLLLEPPAMLGFDHPEARAAIRRVNQMHRSYDIPNHEMLYVLSTFVVVPARWLSAYGKRALTPVELRGSVNYYRALGRHMGIKDVPETYAGFARLMDSYEEEHFGFESGARRVADATLALMETFYAAPLRPAVRVFGKAMLDDALLTAFRYRRPPAPVVRAAHAGLRLRGRLLRLAPARRRAKAAVDSGWIRSYPDGYDVRDLGTFPVPGVAGCPVRHDTPAPQAAAG